MHAGRERSFDPALSDPTPTRKGKLKMNATTVSWPHPLRCGPSLHRSPDDAVLDAPATGVSIRRPIHTRTTRVWLAGHRHPRLTDRGHRGSEPRRRHPSLGGVIFAGLSRRTPALCPSPAQKLGDRAGAGDGCRRGVPDRHTNELPPPSRLVDAVGPVRGRIRNWLPDLLGLRRRRAASRSQVTRDVVIPTRAARVRN